MGTRRDGRVFAILPAYLDPARRAYYSPPGTRRPFASTAEAGAWLAAEIARRLDPTPAGAARTEATAVYLARWHADHLPLWPPRTARAYRRSLALLVPYLGAVPLGELSHELIRGALSRLLGSTWQRQRRDGTVTRAPAPYSRRTVMHARMVLGLALGDLVPDVLPSNPVRRTRLPKAQAPEQPVWDAAQAEAFQVQADTLPYGLGLAFRLILRRALRRGEVMALRWSDIDERRGVLVIDETAGQRAGEVGDTKGRRRREIPLGTDLLARLRAHRAACPVLTPWVFANPETGKPWHAEHLAHKVGPLCRAIGIPPIAPKDMRATCATVYLARGLSLPRVSSLLGHAGIAVTSQHYARIIDQSAEQIAQSADEMDVLFADAADSARADVPRPIRQAE